MSLIRMCNSKLQVFLTVILISSMGFYIFSSFQEKRSLASELGGLNLQLKRSKNMISKYKKRYETSHSNEQQYAQSNRDLQLNLAKQDKHLVDLSQQLDGEKTKLSDAFLFYTQMKSLFGISEESDSHEQKVDAIIINSLKEKLTQWKNIVETHELLKKNLTELLKKGDKPKDEIENLHISQRNLRKIQVKTSKDFIELKKLHADLQRKYTNVTNVCNKQVATRGKLQKQLEKCKLKLRNKKNDTMKAKMRKMMKNVLGSSGKKLVQDNIRDDVEDNLFGPLKSGSKPIDKQVLNMAVSKSHVNVATTNSRNNMVPLKQGVAASNNKLIRQSSVSAEELYINGKGNIPPSEVLLHLTNKSTTISQNMPQLAHQIRLLNKTTDLVQNKDAVSSKDIEKQRTVHIKKKHRTVSAKVRKTTIAPSLIKSSDNNTLQSDEDEVKEHFRRHSSIYEKDFDSQPKHEPPHI